MQECRAYTHTDVNWKRNTHVDACMCQNPSKTETICTFFHVFGKVNTDKKYARGKKLNEKVWEKIPFFYWAGPHKE